MNNGELVRAGYRAAAIALTCAGVGASGIAVAQERYPAKPVRVIVPFPAGGPTDIVGRVFAAKLTELLGQQFIVENRTGGAGNIGTDAAAKAPPDGYTLLVATVSTHAINPGLYKKLPYDPVKDFAAIAQVGVTPTILSVHPSIPAKDVKGLVALAKANPGKLTYGSAGTGSIWHLCAEQFKAGAGGLNILHIPYRGSAPMNADLMAGHVAMAFDATPTALPLVQASKIRAIGAGMATRARALPELPTLQEQGIKAFECYTWNAFFAPAKTPPAIVSLLSESINKALADPVVFKRLQEAGIDPTPGSNPEKLAHFLKAELAKWAPIIKASGAELD